MSGRYLLWTEDDPDDEHLIRLALAGAYLAGDVLFVQDGVDALDFLRRDGDGRGLPAAMILDLKMPRIDGFELLKLLRADPRTRSLPIVVFSSSQREEDVRRCRDLGADSYAVKPVDYVELRAAIESLAREWLKPSGPGGPARA